MKISKIVSGLLMLGVLKAASAGIVVVTVDDFNTAGPRALATTNGAMNFGVVDQTTGLPFVGTNPNGVFSVSTGSFISGGGSLTYSPGVVLPSNALNASIIYSMVFSNLGNPISSLNQVDVNNKVNSFGFVGGGSGNLPVNTAVAYTSGADIVFKFVDNRALSWDLAIDSVGVSFSCAGVDNTNYLSIAAFNAAGVKCVPEPGSMALLGAGGIVAAFATRRRILKSRVA